MRNAKTISPENNGVSRISSLNRKSARLDDCFGIREDQIRD
jgi:hypothetical protein